MSTYLVTTTPPTPNGDLHVGHLAGPYLAADVFVRYQKLRGSRAVYLSSSDDHQSYVVTTAQRAHRAPASLAQHYAGVITATLRAADIDVDLFTTALGNPGHVEYVQAFFRDLHANGLLRRKKTVIPYCRTCTRYLFESFVKGKCPFCTEEAAGNLCEACGRVNDPVDLLDATCSICGTAPSLVEHTGLYFPLEPHRHALAEYYASRASWRPHLKALCRSLVSHPLPDYPASYPTDWGIRVPLDGFSDQAINVWLEMYPGHIAAAQAWARLSGDAALADRLWSGEATIVQFLGYDNSFFNAVLHAALAIAMGGRYALPEHIITNEFYLLGGEKFSTSRRHAIWGTDILSNVQPDVLRYYLSRTNPEHMQTSFSYSEFGQVVDRELVGVWSPTINDLLRCLHDDCRGLVPPGDDIDLQARGLLEWAKTWLEDFYDARRFSLRQASAILHAYMEGCADYRSRAVLPLRDTRSRAYFQRVRSLAYLVKGLAYLVTPVMPSFAERLWAGLGFPGRVSEQRWDGAVEPRTSGAPVGPRKEWFLPTGNQDFMVPVGMSGALTGGGVEKEEVGLSEGP